MTGNNQPTHQQSDGQGPRIYVACLAAYNNGSLHGRWIDADQDFWPGGDCRLVCSDFGYLTLVGAEWVSVFGPELTLVSRATNARFESKVPDAAPRWNVRKRPQSATPTGPTTQSGIRPSRSIKKSIKMRTLTDSTLVCG